VRPPERSLLALTGLACNSILESLIADRQMALRRSTYAMTGQPETRYYQTDLRIILPSTLALAATVTL
jgi:hypothetical protein